MISTYKIKNGLPKSHCPDPFLIRISWQVLDQLVNKLAFLLYRKIRWQIRQANQSKTITCVLIFVFLRLTWNKISNKWTFRHLSLADQFSMMSSIYWFISAIIRASYYTISSMTAYALYVAVLWGRVTKNRPICWRRCIVFCMDRVPSRWILQVRKSGSLESILIMLSMLISRDESLM